MVQAAHLREFDHSPWYWSHHRPRNRAVLCQRPMRTRVVIVLEEILEDSLEMSFADDDNMIQAFPAEGSDQPFGVRILPRRARRNGLFFDPEGRHALGELRTVDATFVHRDHITLRAARKSRSELRRVGALTVRFNTSTWCRNARFSMTR